MKIMDLIIDEMKKENPGAQIERLHNNPVQIVETPAGLAYKDIGTGRFVETEKR